ncbi:MAG TPA: PEP-CTERM sorting domain-containing protein [Fimbriiglobus sp.]|nr:PEP-CTERM sorting domain-containing protein [Fimbriiglobus sp.]
MTTRPPGRGRLAATAALFVLLAAGPSAHAGLMTFTASPYTGDPAGATVTFDDAVSPGSVRVTITVNPNPNIGDINGFFLNIGNETLLPGLSITGPQVTLVDKSANAVTSAGPGNNMNGEGVGPFDIGLRIGSPGIGKDDIQTTSFLLSDPDVTLTNEMFAGATTEDGDIFGLRLTSVGLPSSNRNGSSKLTNDSPPPPPLAQTPEPSTLVGLGTLSILGLLARRVSRPSSRA